MLLPLKSFPGPLAWITPTEVLLCTGAPPNEMWFRFPRSSVIPVPHDEIADSRVDSCSRSDSEAIHTGSQITD